MSKPQNHHESRFLRPRADVTNALPIYEDRIAVRRLEWPDEENGILVPEIAKRTSGHQLGEVIGLGPGRSYVSDVTTGKTKPFADGSRDTFEVEIGTKVVYARSPTTEIEDGEWNTISYLFEEQAILAVLENDGTLRPLYDRIVVKRAQTETSIGDLAIPESAQVESSEGEVIAVGGGRRRASGKVVPLEVVVGDQILFSPHAGSYIRLSGHEYIILHEHEVLGVREMAA